jgi:hypothetical protein
MRGGEPQKEVVLYEYNDKDHKKGCGLNSMSKFIFSDTILGY